MKRTLSICLLLLCVLSASAQIQRNFLGYTLGSTTKSVIYNKYKTNKLFHRYANGDFCVGDITFAGQKWDVVMFEFTNNKLASIQFFLTEPISSISEMDIVWDRLSGRLLEKYSDYYREASTSDVLQFVDSKTFLSLMYRSINYSKGLALRYSDRDLTRQQTQSEIDEL